MASRVPGPAVQVHPADEVVESYSWTEDGWDLEWQRHLKAAQHHKGRKLSECETALFAQLFEERKSHEKRVMAIRFLSDLKEPLVGDTLWQRASDWNVKDLRADSLTSYSGERLFPTFLQQLGITVADGHLVFPAGTGLQIELQLDSHEEHVGSTWYLVHCSLCGCASTSEPQRWQTPRRLCQLRELHDAVKRHMPTYPEEFADSPFAHSLAPPGTTARLSAWLTTLARLMNERKLGPESFALVLEFFQAEISEQIEPFGMLSAATPLHLTQADEVATQAQRSIVDVMTHLCI